MPISESESIPLSLLDADTLKTLREQLFEEGILHEGDSIGTDDKTLLRFLRARKFNLNETKKMIKNCQRWRQTVLGVGIDELSNKVDPFDCLGRAEILKSWSMYFHKTDKKGRPVNVHSLGGLNLPELYKHITPEQLVEFIIVNTEIIPLEVLPAASRAGGHTIEQILIIVDLEDFSLSHFWQAKSLIRLGFGISQDYYPETMGQLAIVNAPSSFTFIWSIIKPWLSKETLENVDVLGKNYKDVLLQIVDGDNLPVTLGGNCTCSHAGGCGFSSAGPWMEERLARQTTTEEGVHRTRPRESSISNGTLSELTPSIIKHVEQGVEPADEIHEKVICEDLTLGPTTRRPEMT